MEYACQFIGNPYVWGGTSLTNGADCSGFVQSVYAHFGISLPRTTWDQEYAGTAVSYDQAAPGDLILYEGHVGIYMGDGQIVNTLDRVLDRRDTCHLHADQDSAAGDLTKRKKQYRPGKRKRLAGVFLCAQIDKFFMSKQKNRIHVQYTQKCKTHVKKWGAGVIQVIHHRNHKKGGKIKVFPNLSTLSTWKTPILVDYLW